MDVYASFKEVRLGPEGKLIEVPIDGRISKVFTAVMTGLFSAKRHRKKLPHYRDRAIIISLNPRDTAP